MTPGTRLGPYEIREPLGEGAMGKVYRARDTRLGREVAVKILPPDFSADPKRRWRFEQEARAASRLNHPNILALYDVGSTDELQYVVTEVLEGQTLRARMGGTAVPPRKAVDYAAQIAQGLAAAHDAGIVHRDLKPENIFVTNDGRVKILDFGLAKLDREDADTAERSRTLTTTEPGTVLGTAAYMSPEQVRGATADHRSDVFSFGAVLFEMLAGRPAFRREYAVDTMSAILNEDVPDLSGVRGGVPPELEAIVRHCLEKSPAERFQSARDIAFGLESLSGLSGLGSVPGRVRPRLRWTRLRRQLPVSLAIVAVAVAAFLARDLVRGPGVPTFRQLTFRRGTLHAARFAPDGHTIVFSAAWDGRPVELFSTRPESPEARPLGLPATQLLSVSAQGDMAFVQGGFAYFGGGAGTLARAPLAGGAPREVARDVQQADWAPDGTIALVRAAGGKSRLEYPPGRVLYETPGWISDPRFSPDGRRIAFLEHPVRGDDRGSVAVIESAGQARRVLTDGWGSLQGLAWNPRRGEVWFTGARTGVARGLWSVTLRGKERLLARSAGPLTLLDVAPDGRILATHGRDRVGILARLGADAAERDVSWLDRSIASDLADDGTLLFYESGDGGGPNYGAYLRRADGSPAVRLGDGLATALSPDGQSALAIVYGPEPRLQILPTGAGEARVFRHPGLEAYHWASFFPDGRRFAFAANARGAGVRLYAQDLSGGEARPFTPEVTPLFCDPISPDGRSVFAIDLERRMVVYPVAGGEARVVPGQLPGDVPAAWSSDGRAIYASGRGEPRPVFRVDLADGSRRLWRDLMPADAAGVTGIFSLRISGDGVSYAYSYIRVLSDLYLIEGVR